MIAEALMAAACCSLFIGMGLAGEIRSRLRLDWKILSCPKCCTFWCVLVLLLARRNGPLPSLTASFISSYLSMWAVLALDALAAIYNKAYEKITQNPGAESAGPKSSPGPGPEAVEASPADEVPQM